MGDLFASIFEWCHDWIRHSNESRERLENINISEQNHSKPTGKSRPSNKKYQYKTKALHKSIYADKLIKKYPYSTKQSNPLFCLLKAPGYIEINGPLAKMNINTVYDSLRKRLTYLYQHYPKNPTNLIEKYMETSFEWRCKRWHIDLAFAYQIKLCQAAEDILGNKSFYKRLEMILEDLHNPKFNVKNNTLLESMIYQELFFRSLSNNDRKRQKKVSKWIIKSRKAVQNCQPCAWSGMCNQMQGQFHSYYAFKYPPKRTQYNKSTFKCFSISREHFIQHDSDIPGSYSWVYCSFQMQNALLQMPLRRHLEFVILEPKNQIQHLIQQSTVKEKDIEKAKLLIQKVKSEFELCDSKYLKSFMYNLFLAVTYFELRCAQLKRKNNAYQKSLSFANRAVKISEVFLKESDPDKDVFYMKYMRIWIQHILEYLYQFQKDLNKIIGSTEKCDPSNSGNINVPQGISLSEYLLTLLEAITSELHSKEVQFDDVQSLVELEVLSSNTESPETEI